MKINYLVLLASLVFSKFAIAQIPVLNSDASITNKVIYLDFNGQVVSGTLWNSGNTINALASTISTVNMVQVWKRVSEDFRPFDVNITTDSNCFNNAPANQRTRVVITPTSAWYGSAGGVAYLGSFTWGGTPGTPCWVFENMLGYSAKNIAEAASHEAGHTLSLRHQSTYSVGCVKTAEYNPGQGTGVTGWAPIMGVGYSKNVTTWFNGTSSSSCTTIQYDHGNVSPGITSSNFLNFRSDDVGNTYATGKTLNLVAYNVLDSGLITTPSDIDVYKFDICNTRSVSFAIKPWALDTTAYNGANLDVRFQLYNAANVLIATDTSLIKLNTLAAVTLTPDLYYFTVDGGGSANYSDYGSIGKYFISIKTTDPPFITNTIIASNTTCVGQNTSFSATSNAAPIYWMWNFAGPSPTVSIINNPVMSFPTPGIYTVSLLAYNNYSASCTVTKTITVGAVPNLSVSPDRTICPGTSVNINAAGALYYNWQPGNLAGPILVLTPSASIVYTLTGSNNLCSSLAMLSLSVTPNFSVNVTASSPVVCTGQSLTLTANGASTYTFNPGNLITNQVITTPTSNVSYTFTGSNGYCTRSSQGMTPFSPDFVLQVIPNDTMICVGESISFISSGASSYTIQPGNLTGNQVTVSPLGTTEYTITGANADNCQHSTLRGLYISICDYIVSNSLTEGSVLVYPNPANQEITLALPASCEKIQVVSTVGAIILEQKAAENTQVDVSRWAEGVYCLLVTFNDHSTVARKIVVRH